MFNEETLCRIIDNCIKINDQLVEGLKDGSVSQQRAVIILEWNNGNTRAMFDALKEKIGVTG